MNREGESSGAHDTGSPVDLVPHDHHPPGKGAFFTVKDGIDSGKRLFFQDYTHGSGNLGATIVFVHGNPESSYTFRKVIKELKRCSQSSFRIVAMDHIGFGLSDQADYEMVCMDHARNLLQLTRYLDLEKVTLVVHDWGGPIGIGAFLEEPWRVTGLVVLNSAVFTIPEVGYTYKNYPISWLGWASTPSIIPDRFWGSFASYAIFRTPAKPAEILSMMFIYIIMAEMGLILGKEKTARRFYRDQFQSKGNVRSSKRLVRQSAHWGEGNRISTPSPRERDTGPFYSFIQDNLRKKWGVEGQNIRVSSIVGRWDPLGKENVINDWINYLPQLQGNVTIFENAGHFIEEEQPVEIAKAIMITSGLR